jgi:hypothetical protein
MNGNSVFAGSNVGEMVGLLPCESSGQTWVQLGCNKTSRVLLSVPKLAIGAVDCQTLTSEPSAVTAEPAGSSPVVPAILFIGSRRENDISYGCVVVCVVTIRFRS